ncbi:MULTISPECIES: aminoglycoside phosphotransferase family protein [unclassified Nonomuraea]|uniref:aminoglycoside phosphotransferase family protein n=1 Tax=unclassified Nonomuraea TaxID=2593643 RepID=UPI0034032A00
MTTPGPIDVPEAFAASYGGQGPEARAWVAGLPRLGGELLGRWELRPDGPPAYGMASLVLPVLQAGGAPAVLKLQQVRAEAAGLRAWKGCHRNTAETGRALDH